MNKTNGDKMSERLKPENIIFQRDESGKLISQEIVLETLPNKPTIRAVPLPRGVLHKVVALAKSSNIDDRVESDNEILKHGLIEPKLTEQQIKDMTPEYSTPISIAILSISVNKSQKEVAAELTKEIEINEKNLKKNLVQTQI